MALAIVSLAIIVGVGAVVLGEMQDSAGLEETDTAYGVLDAGIDALSTFGDFFTVIVVIGVAAVLFLLLGAVRRAGNNGMA